VPPIEVFRLGDDFTIVQPVQPQGADFAALHKHEEYLLVVGTIEARKNHTLLYYTYKLAHQRKIMLPKLVIVGRRGWLTDDIFTLMTTDPEVAEKFVFLQSANDEELAWLYKHCLFSVYPSFYEGWGLPIAESMAYGVPCLASNTSSMPEIAGDLLTYFSPYSTDGCLEAIVSLLNPKKLVEAKKRVARYKPTTWDETFEKTNEAIAKIGA
jgi:glycosyltransferase involved in cell wall biosynthesis